VRGLVCAVRVASHWDRPNRRSRLAGDIKPGRNGLNRAVALRIAACGILGLGAALLIAALLLMTYTKSKIT